MNDYKLISIDLDGTLLNKDSQITDKNKQALIKLMQKGVKVVISSGRSKENIKSYMEELGIKEGYGSAFHGATIFKASDLSVVNETILNKQVALDVLKKLNEYNNIGILVYTKTKLYTTSKNDYVNSYYQKTPVDINVIENYEDIDEEISKILVKGDRSHLCDIKNDFLEMNLDCRTLFSELDLLEFMSKDTNKGFSLEKICEYENIDIQDTIAIGDNFNDIEMIEKAGVGISVCNGVSVLKEKADYITKCTNNEDALYEVINKYFNIN